MLSEDIKDEDREIEIAEAEERDAETRVEAQVDVDARTGEATKDTAEAQPPAGGATRSDLPAPRSSEESGVEMPAGWTPMTALPDPEKRDRGAVGTGTGDRDQMIGATRGRRLGRPAHARRAVPGS